MKNTKRNILTEYHDIRKELQDLTKRIQQLKRISEGTAELEEEYLRQYGKLFAKQFEIEQRIEQLEPVERMLIRYRYFDGMKWEAVCRRINYSDRQTFRLHDKIIKKLNKLER